MDLSDFKAIFEKWDKHDFGERPLELLKTSIKPVEQLFCEFEFVEQELAQREKENVYELIGTVLQYVGMGGFYLGFEYGDLKQSNLTTEEIMNSNQNPRFQEFCELTRTVGEQCLLVYGYVVKLALENKCMKKEDMENKIMNASKVMLMTMTACSKIGFEYSTKNSIKQ